MECNYLASGPHTQVPCRRVYNSQTLASHKYDFKLLLLAMPDLVLLQPEIIIIIIIIKTPCNENKLE